MIPVEISDDDVLICPSCGGDCLHSGGVTVFDRTEDAGVTRVTTTGEIVTVEERASAGSGNPSSRRHAVAVRFWCETCGDAPRTYELTLSQHKGQTLVLWREAQ